MEAQNPFDALSNDLLALVLSYCMLHTDVSRVCLRFWQVFLKWRLFEKQDFFVVGDRCVNLTCSSLYILPAAVPYTQLVLHYVESDPTLNPLLGRKDFVGLQHQFCRRRSSDGALLWISPKSNRLELISPQGPVLRVKAFFSLDQTPPPEGPARRKASKNSVPYFSVSGRGGPVCIWRPSWLQCLDGSSLAPMREPLFLPVHLRLLKAQSFHSGGSLVALCVKIVDENIDNDLPPFPLILRCDTLQPVHLKGYGQKGEEEQEEGAGGGKVAAFSFSCAFPCGTRKKKDGTTTSRVVLVSDTEMVCFAISSKTTATTSKEEEKEEKEEEGVFLWRLPIPNGRDGVRVSGLGSSGMRVRNEGPYLMCADGSVVDTREEEEEEMAGKKNPDSNRHVVLPAVGEMGKCRVFMLRDKDDDDDDDEEEEDGVVGRVIITSGIPKCQIRIETISSSSSSLSDSLTFQWNVRMRELVDPVSGLGRRPPDINGLSFAWDRRRQCVVHALVHDKEKGFCCVQSVHLNNNTHQHIKRWQTVLPEEFFFGQKGCMCWVSHFRTRVRMVGRGDRVFVFRYPINPDPSGKCTGIMLSAETGEQCSPVVVFPLNPRKQKGCTLQ